MKSDTQRILLGILYSLLYISAGTALFVHLIIDNKMVWLAVSFVLYGIASFLFDTMRLVLHLWFQHWTKVAIRRKPNRVPITMSELWGPIPCQQCQQPCFTLWVTPEERDKYSFVDIYGKMGQARCDACGPPTEKES